MVARPAAVAGSAPAVERMRRLAQGALVVMTGFLLSRLLGAVRNIVIAAHFGAGPQYGAYVAAIALPDVVFQVLVGGAVGSAFIPVFKRYHALGRDDEAWHLTSSVINMFALVALVTSAILAVFARPIMDVWVAGQDAEFRDLVANLTRILLISPAVFAVSTFCSSVLNSYNRFAFLQQEVGRNDGLFAVLAAAEEDQVDIIRIESVPEASLVYVDCDAAPLSAPDERQDVAAIAIHAHQVGIQVDEPNLPRIHARTPFVEGSVALPASPCRSAGRTPFRSARRPLTPARARDASRFRHGCGRARRQRT